MSEESEKRKMAMWIEGNQVKMTTILSVVVIFNLIVSSLLFVGFLSCLGVIENDLQRTIKSQLKHEIVVTLEVYETPIDIDPNITVIDLVSGPNPIQDADGFVTAWKYEFRTTDINLTGTWHDAVIRVYIRKDVYSVFTSIRCEWIVEEKGQPNNTGVLDKPDFFAVPNNPLRDYMSEVEVTSLLFQDVFDDPIGVSINLVV